MRNLDKHLQILVEKWQELAKDARETALDGPQYQAMVGHTYGVSDGLGIAAADLIAVLKKLHEEAEAQSSDSSQQ